MGRKPTYRRKNESNTSDVLQTERSTRRDSKNNRAITRADLELDRRAVSLLVRPERKGGRVEKPLRKKVCRGSELGKRPGGSSRAPRALAVEGRAGAEKGVLAD